MKDLDFDELDKAVNSLMTNVPKNNDSGTAALQPSENTLDRTPMSQAKNVVPAPTTPSAQQPSSRQAPPASRRSGRFMDVVHPSVNAKPQAPARPVSREGAALQPRPSQAPTEPQVPEPKPVSASTPPVTEKTPPTSDWPDPLEMTSQKTEEPTKPEVPPVVAPSMPMEKPGTSAEPAPLSSPFLTDAKVEKRPLGSSSPTATASVATSTVSEGETKTGAVDDSAAQLPAMPGDVEPQMPEELQDDLMAVEADTHMGVPKTDESHPLETTSEPKKEEKKLEAPAAPVLLEESTKVEEKPAGPPSIPQQYREEPSSGEKESGAIYDTDTYHQPLTHPAKKKSGWLWVLWIVIILLVGAGGGAALYFLGIV